MWRASGNFCIPARSSIIFTAIPGLGFDADEAELAAALAQFPDADPSRPFAAGKCTNAVFDGAGANPRHLLDLDRADRLPSAGCFAGKVSGNACWKLPPRKIWRTKNIPTARRADLYRLDLDAENAVRIEEAANRLASGKLRAALRVLPSGRVHSLRLPAVGK